MRKVLLILSAATVLLTIVPERSATACTIGVASGAVTADGRPILWKARQWTDPDGNQVVRRTTADTTYPYEFIGVRGMTETEIRMGVNEHGLVVGNALNGGSQNSWFMEYALGNFVSAQEAIDYLNDHEGVDLFCGSSFEFIDAAGAAYMIEAENAAPYVYVYDTLTPARRAQGMYGWVVRENGNPHRNIDGTDDATGGTRYTAGKTNIMGLVGWDQLSSMTVTQGNNGWLGYEFLRNDTIEEDNVCSGMTVHGVRPNEDSDLTTMWVIVGHPEDGIAVPLWVASNFIPTALNTDDMADLTNALRPRNQQWVQAATLPLEHRLFTEVAELMEYWRHNVPRAISDMPRVEQQMADDACSLLTRLGAIAPPTTDRAPVAQIRMECIDPALGLYEFDSQAYDPGTGSITQCSWNYGDGTPVETGLVVDHTFGFGVYLISCTALDDTGVTFTDWIYLEIADPSGGCEGACCYDANCVITTEVSCNMPLAGHWMGVGSTCIDADLDGVADICEQFVPEACCDSDGTCSMLNPDACLAAGGTPQGAGTDCDPNPCLVPVGACCYDTACVVTTEVSCNMPPVGHWMGAGSTCVDADLDGVADVCEPQACCDPDGTCSMLTTDACLAAGGTPMGAGIDCDPNPCREPVGACCSDGRCVVTTEAICDMAAANTWMGPGTDCDDLDGDGVADICETASYEACCEKDGTCTMKTVKECLGAGGQPQGPGSACVGDWDGDKQDETCEVKWIQPPDLAKTGIDVDDTFPLMLANDWLCTETNAITRIYVWGSWRHDQLPERPENVSFRLAIHNDIPDPDGTGPAYSMPGDEVWRRDVKVGNFIVRPFKEKIQEGFWDPSREGSYEFPGDTVCWLYIFDIPAKEAFCQRGAAGKPIVYWLSVQATPGPTTLPYATFFGWKTSTKHWNDDSVYRQDTGSAITPWYEMRYPKGHPWATESVDLAFALDTQPCVLSSGDEAVAED